jgi:hypothetical protein
MSDRVDALFELIRRGLIDPLGRLGSSLGKGLGFLAEAAWRRGAW